MMCYHHMRFIILRNVSPANSWDGDTSFVNQLLKKKKLRSIALFLITKKNGLDRNFLWKTNV